MAEIIKDYELVNHDKLQRAIFGSVAGGGSLKGGVGEDASDGAKLAEYDRLGGLIRKGGRKVKTGSFWDFSKKKPREKPQVVFVFRDLEGNEVEIAEGKEIPLEIQAAETIKDKKVGKKGKK